MNELKYFLTKDPAMQGFFIKQFVPRQAIESSWQKIIEKIKDFVFNLPGLTLSCD